jgi:4-oxalocrotonate tautomerase
MRDVGLASVRSLPKIESLTFAKLGKARIAYTGNASISRHNFGATMPTINIQLFEGRTLEQKRAFAEAVTKVTVETLGGTAAGVQVIFTDVKRENWATGGRLASDPPKR